MIDEWICLRWERETRYYEMYLHQDLWGGWVLTRVWGRRGTVLGRVVHRPCMSYEEGCERLAAVQARRESRGYKVRDWILMRNRRTKRDRPRCAEVTLFGTEALREHEAQA